MQLVKVQIEKPDGRVWLIISWLDETTRAVKISRTLLSAASEPAIRAVLDTGTQAASFAEFEQNLTALEGTL